MDTANSRRQFLLISAIAGSGLALTACGNKAMLDRTEQTKDKDEQGAEVTATEDLMREHGVLRRALLVYAETGPKLRSNPSLIAPDALQRTRNYFARSARIITKRSWKRLTSFRQSLKQVVRQPVCPTFS